MSAEPSSSPVLLAGEGPDDPQLTVVITMVDTLELFAVAEIERALRLTLHGPGADPAAERVGRLGFLAELLEQEGTWTVDDPEAWPGVPVIARQRFDELAPPGHISSGALVSLHGTWLRACRAAYGLRPDGRHTGPGRPWITRRGVRHARFRWTADDCLSWLRRCARELGRQPTSTDYNAWRRELVRVPGQQALRAPWAKTIAEHAGDGAWAKAMSRLGVTDDELAAIRAERLPALRPTPMSAGERIASLSDNEREQLALNVTQARKLKARKGRYALTLTAALELSHALGGSLDWLADRVELPGEPLSSDARLAPARVKQQRERMHVSEKDLREAARLSLGDWRKLMSGSREPTLGDLAALAEALRTQIDELVTQP